jgi:hypothetical protein
MKKYFVSYQSQSKDDWGFGNAFIDEDKEITVKILQEWQHKLKAFVPTNKNEEKLVIMNFIEIKGD